MSATVIGAQLRCDAENTLPEALQVAFRARAREIFVRREQIILAEGLHSTDVFLIISGKVKVSLFSRQGRETILREMGPGQIFGELSAIDDQPRSASIVALVDTGLKHLSGEEFIEFLDQTPSAGLWMARQLSARVRDLTEKIFELTTMPVNTRLHCELMRIRLNDVAGGDTAVIERFPTHSDLASRIGTHREAVTRELGLLTREGILKQAGRRMHILSVSRLRAMILRFAL